MTVSFYPMPEKVVREPARHLSDFVPAWLRTIAALVFAMVVVGGATRLTGSGLSITEWQPLLGTLPPLNEAAWAEAFEKYKAIPQYTLINKGMTLPEFQEIYWWEWAHRFLGRAIGLVFLIPFVVFLSRRAIPRPFIPRIALLFVLGGSQGALGWFMVKSGLVDRVDVSQYRLAAHLSLATVIGGYAFWLALTLRSATIFEAAPPHPLQRAFAAPNTAASSGRISRKNIVSVGAAVLCTLIFLQIVSGAFVAGLKGGHASDTWPLMDGALVPPGLIELSPVYLNAFENPLTAQFDHRMLAYAVLALAIFLAAAIWRSEADGDLRATISAILAAIGLQIALGVATVVYAVPLHFALAHQANAMVLFALCLWHLHRAVKPGPAPGLR